MCVSKYHTENCLIRSENFKFHSAFNYPWAKEEMMNARSTDFGTIIYRFQIAFNAWMNSINTGRDWTQRNALTCPKGSTSSWESRKISYDIKPIVPNIEIVIEKKRAEGTYNIFHLFISKYNCAKLIFSTFWMINSVKVCNQSFGLARRWNRLIRDPIDFFFKVFFWAKQ